MLLYKDLRMMGFRTQYPQNMAPWHIEYFKLEESETTTEAEDYSELFCSPFSPETSQQNPPERDALLNPGERSILISKDKRTQEESEQIGLTKFPQNYYVYFITLCPFIFLHNCSLFIKLSIKILRFKKNTQV